MVLSSGPLITVENGHGNQREIINGACQGNKLEGQFNGHREISYGKRTNYQKCHRVVVIGS